MGFSERLHPAPASITITSSVYIHARIMRLGWMITITFILTLAFTYIFRITFITRYKIIIMIYIIKLIIMECIVAIVL